MRRRATFSASAESTDSPDPQPFSPTMRTASHSTPDWTGPRPSPGSTSSSPCRARRSCTASGRTSRPSASRASTSSTPPRSRSSTLTATGSTRRPGAPSLSRGLSSPARRACRRSTSAAPCAPSWRTRSPRSIRRPRSGSPIRGLPTPRPERRPPMPGPSWPWGPRAAGPTSNSTSSSPPPPLRHGLHRAGRGASCAVRNRARTPVLTPLPNGGRGLFTAPWRGSP